ncbi:MAG: hypothetical protein U9O94_09820 [Nanoarchaeota archaeon]|nr:hypothetical protein [Nanoarchaeota archaeon]
MQLRLSTQALDNSLNWEKLEADFLDGVNLNLTGGNNNATVTGLLAGVLDNDAVNMAQFNAALEGLKQKFYARAISPATNVTISGPQTVDGVNCVDGDLVLLGGQTTATEDGLYIVRAGAWERADHWEVGDEVGAFLISIQEGTSFDNTGWIVTNNKGADIVGTDDLAYIQAYGPGAVGGSNGLSMSGSDVILGGNLTQNTVVNGGFSHTFEFADMDGFHFQTGSTRIDADYYGGHTGIRIRNGANTVGVSVNDNDLASGVQLRASLNMCQLLNQPDGTVPLAISTTQYVDDAIAGGDLTVEELTVADNASVTLTGGDTASTIKRVYQNGNKLISTEFVISDDGSNRVITEAGTADFSNGDVIEVEYIA